MATSAVLRSIRRRDPASSLISAYKNFSANTSSSCAPAFTDLRYGSLARNFSSKSAGYSISGIDFGSMNSHGSIMGSKVTPSVAAFYQKGLFVGVPSKHHEFYRDFSTIAADKHDNLADDNKKVLRPLSPHLPVYKPQTNSTSSILNRFSGAYLAALVVGFHVLYLKAGSVSLSYSNFYQFFFYSSKLSQLSLEIAAVAMAYHVVYGVRHLVGDFSRYLFPKIGRSKLK
ncbi:hypothetical protein DM860_003758 [Cuscuta australis]|uniref:Succinate dehydrogenase subunit 3 n=1 Tax=Cuscuta australis TaxID=267555 RepID=A0A328DL37_9ASTE|nr:hypothetical protein DM860_003758 [Cuscuta australis]